MEEEWWLHGQVQIDHLTVSLVPLGYCSLHVLVYCIILAIFSLRYRVVLCTVYTSVYWSSTHNVLRLYGSISVLVCEDKIKSSKNVVGWVIMSFCDAHQKGLFFSFYVAAQPKKAAGRVTSVCERERQLHIVKSAVKRVTQDTRPDIYLTNSTYMYI